MSGHVGTRQTLEVRNDYDYDVGVALYNPNGVLSMTAFVVFAFLAVFLWIRFFRTGRKKAKWTLALPIGTTVMSLGYILRFSRRNHINAWSFLGEQVFLLTSPCFFLAFDYAALPRLSLHLEADDCLWMRRTWIVKTFVWLDVLTFLAQLGGSGLQASTTHLALIGNKVALGGLALQAVCFAGFISLYVVFARRLRTFPQHQGKWNAVPWQRSGWPRFAHWRALYLAIGASCLCIAIRSIYRVAEFAGGHKSWLANSDACLYVFDALPMACNVGALILVWAPPCLADEQRPDAENGGLPLVQSKVEERHGHRSSA